MAEPSKEAPFFRVESLAVMGSQTSAVSESGASVAQSSSQFQQLTLAVEPLRGRTLGLSVVVIAVLAGLTVVFMNGMALTTFQTGEKTPAQQTQLLDDYNSYSGNLASVFSKPVELFVALTTQLLVLSFLADAIVARPSPAWRAVVAALVLSSGLGYLVRNGISALNVQLRARETQPFVGASDLSVLANASSASAVSTTSQVSTVAHTLAEGLPQNAATNTILRNLLLSPPTRVATQCKPVEDDAYEIAAEPSVAFGIPQLDWQSRVLPQGLNVTKSLSFAVNVSATSQPTTAPTGDLPMDASLAADLFLYATIEAPRSLPWGPQLGFKEFDVWDKRFPVELKTGQEVRSEVGSMADFTGLLPREEGDHADENAQRSWLLSALIPAVVRQFNQSTNTSKDRVHLEFSHVEISPSLRFDALTIEAEVAPELLTDFVATLDGTRYTNVPLTESCGPWAGPCLFKKQQYTSSPAVEFDSTAQIQAFSPCADDNGKERLTYVLNHTVRGFFDTVRCPQRAKSSVFVTSVAKRLVADSFVQNKSVNASGIFTDPNSAIATNLRKIYSFTIGRLAWQLEDLSKAFNADCEAGNCHGLQLPLTPISSATEPQQRIVVGAEALPLDLLVPYPAFLYSRARRATLARVYEPKQLRAREETYMRLAGDMLLPHNIGNVTWDKSLTATPFRCDDLVEDRLRMGVDNHFYMEQSLQPAYTAATLFLFQHAVVRSAISLHTGAQSLDFEANAQPIALWISIPAQNAWLTLAGCALLVVCVALVVVGASPAPLQAISAPQAIARVLLDEAQFPPLLLHRQVPMHDKEGTKMEEIDSFHIGSLTLEPVIEGPEPLEATVSHSRDDTDRLSHKV